MRVRKIFVVQTESKFSRNQPTHSSQFLTNSKKNAIWTDMPSFFDLFANFVSLSNTQKKTEIWSWVTLLQSSGDSINCFGFWKKPIHSLVYPTELQSFVCFLFNSHSMMNRGILRICITDIPKQSGVCSTHYNRFFLQLHFETKRKLKEEQAKHTACHNKPTQTHERPVNVFQTTNVSPKVFKGPDEMVFVLFFNFSLRKNLFVSEDTCHFLFLLRLLFWNLISCTLSPKK